MVFEEKKKQVLGKRHSLQQTVLGKLDIHLQKTETGFLSLTLYKKLIQNRSKILT
jgi:hypothetical protein